MRTARFVALILTASLVLAPGPAHADRETVQDTTAYDVAHADIDMKSLTVTYNSKGVVAKLRFHDLRRTKRLRLLVQFYNTAYDDPYAPRYGNFLELRMKENGRLKRVNWEFGPDDAYDDYHPVKCRRMKIKPDFDKDVITYKLPKRCANFVWERGYITSYASTRKFKVKHWDDGSPSLTTGDWFDTTPGLVIKR